MRDMLDGLFVDVIKVAIVTSLDKWVKERGALPKDKAGAEELLNFQAKEILDHFREVTEKLDAAGAFDGAKEAAFQALQRKRGAQKLRTVVGES